MRLLQAYLVKGGQAMVTTPAILEGLLGVFLKLISSRVRACLCVRGGGGDRGGGSGRGGGSLPPGPTLFRWIEAPLSSLSLPRPYHAAPRNIPPAGQATDLEGFHLLGAVVEILPQEKLAPYIQPILSSCFMRLSKSKTAKFVRGMMVFVCLLAGRHGGPYVVDAVEGVQAGLFVMLMNRLTEDVKAVFGHVEKKTVVVGLTKLLTETPALLGPFAQVCVCARA